MPPFSEAAWTVPALFVYGLLRPGERFWPDLEASVSAVSPARVRGGLWWHASGGYPLVDPTDDGWVHGDLLQVEPTPQLHALVFMELCAGYEARYLEAWTEPDDAPASAVTFCWPWGASHRGERITTGDWRRR